MYSSAAGRRHIDQFPEGCKLFRIDKLPKKVGDSIKQLDELLGSIGEMVGDFAHSYSP